MLARFIIINNIAIWFPPIMYNINIYISIRKRIQSWILKLACNWVTVILNRGKSQSESAVIARFRQVQLHIQNKTCILHSAIEYSERLLTIHQCRRWSGFTCNPYLGILRFSCQLPARMYDGHVDHKANRSIVRVIL